MPKYNVTLDIHSTVSLIVEAAGPGLAEEAAREAFNNVTFAPDTLEFKVVKVEEL